MTPRPLLLLLLVLGLPRAAAPQEAARHITIEQVQIDPAIAVRETTPPIQPVCPVCLCPPPPPPQSCPPAEGAQRRLLDDDSIEITYTDGTVKVVHPDGKIVTTYPDGTTYEEKPWQAISQVPYASPPEPPGEGSSLALWLELHNQNLLRALGTLLSHAEDGQASLDRYQEKERAQGIDLYEQIASRTELLEKLLNN